MNGVKLFYEEMMDSKLTKSRYLSFDDLIGCAIHCRRVNVLKIFGVQLWKIIAVRRPQLLIFREKT